MGILTIAWNWLAAHATPFGIALPVLADCIIAVVAAAAIAALFARDVIAFAGIVGLTVAAFLAADQLVGTPEAEVRSVLLGGSAWVLAVGALLARRRIRGMRERIAALESELVESSHLLDRERLWRRLSPGDHENIPDEEMQALLARVGARLPAPPSDADVLPPVAKPHEEVVAEPVGSTEKPVLQPASGLEVPAITHDSRAG